MAVKLVKTFMKNRRKFFEKQMEKLAIIGFFLYTN